MALFLVHLNKKIMPTNFTSDLPDSDRDKAKLQPDEATLDLPDVKDIPGQEFVHALNLNEMADTTISSDDEEGVGLFDDETDNTSGRVATDAELSEDDLIIDDEDDLNKLLDDEEEDDELEDDDIDVIDDHVSDDSDVTEEEKKLLQQTEDVDSQDNENLYLGELDDTDFDGEKLNEDSDDISGDDLDVPGAEADDPNEDIGEEDEENNEYSLGDTE
jgi:hypothetical protein